MAEAGSWYARWGKRTLDVVGASILLVLLAPVLAAAALILRAADGPGILFRQVRAGRGGSPFTLLKLRTMRPPAHAGEPDADRLTPLGRALRATALDEVPQLVNVLRGEMSLVGPRPLPVEYLPLYSAREATRLRSGRGWRGRPRRAAAMPFLGRSAWNGTRDTPRASRPLPTSGPSSALSSWCCAGRA
ncbi:sugar transferase [Roseomonas sp. CCTCC AB2023176]|uniref:sugar transferase n=1 Tax=Roseomonas sp. CCTCC AB2023176 TaxID=3342640 RepID=UPI0035DFDF30